METLKIILIVVTSASLIIFIISTMMIFNVLKKRGEKVNFFLIRLFMISYAFKYKEITKKETGSIGYLFYLWISSINLTLISFATYLILSSN